MLNRDINWLSFNERVLQEAQDKTVPLIERMRFLGIYSNNLDEFFRVRVATLLRLVKELKHNNEELVNSTTEVLDQIQAKVIRLQAQFYSAYQEILGELESHKIFITNEKELNQEQQEFVRQYFIDEVESLITPIILSNLKKFPYLKDKAVYLFIAATKKSGKPLYALIELPTDDISRFLELPGESDSKHIIYLDDVIRYNMPYILSIFETIDIESYIVKLTRDAELDLDDDFSESYYERLVKSLSNRKRGKVVRLVYDKEIKQEYLDYMLSNLKMSIKGNLIPGGKYHNFRDFMGFPSLGRNDLCYEPLVPLEHKKLTTSRPLLKQVLEKDILLQFPYHSFDYVIDLIREAAIDPKVTTIKISLYRVAPKSKVIKALKNAARNGKQIKVIIELRARFDEEANLDWSRQLQEDNISIDFGIKGLKVHSKLLLIQRLSKGEMKSIALISTGNFHEKTAKIYGDTALLTAHSDVTNEVEHLFDIFDKPYLPYTFNHLLVAPINLRKRLYELIDEQVNNVREGIPASIFLKLNNLVDEAMIHKLEWATEQGVPMKLLIRGVCSMMPQANLEIRSLVGRFLEHSRIFSFGEGLERQLYIGSADLMTRNLDIRIEALTPIYDLDLKKELNEYLDLQWSDNVNARLMDGINNNVNHTNDGALVNAQMDIYTMLK